MKRLIRLFCLIAAATALGSCARDKVIPDEELARIFRDAYLINAYVSDRGVKLDSLELYEPVFSRYGYTAEDVRYTIGNFSRRKSAKLSDVVEQSIRLLEEESAYYKYEVGVLDTIDNVARSPFHPHGLFRLADPGHPDQGHRTASGSDSRHTSRRIPCVVRLPDRLAR